MDRIDFVTLFDQAARILSKKSSFDPSVYQHMELEQLLQEIEIFYAELEAQNEELREQQQTLNLRNKDLTLLFDHAPVGYLLLDGGHIIHNANLQAMGILGLTKSRLRHEQFYNYLAPGEVRRFLDWCIDYEKTREPLHVPLRCRDRIHHVVLDLQAHDGKGDEQRLFLSIRDETELFQTAFERDRYLEMIDKHVMISRTDFDGVIQYVSSAFCGTTGFSKEELIGVRHNLLRDPDTPESVYAELWNTITAGETWKGELRNRKKNGEFYWVNATISPWYDEEGAMVGYTAIRQNITDQKRIETLSKQDSLTGLYNRAKLDELLHYEFSQAKRYYKALSLIMLDIDHFKDINDNFGHLKGDEVLKKLADVLSNQIRESDSVGRWGGEEFLIISPNTDTQGARQLAEKIRNLVASYDFGGLGVTCSFGVGTYRHKEKESEATLLGRTDSALYRAKEQGRNRVMDEAELFD